MGSFPNCTHPAKATVTVSYAKKGSPSPATTRSAELAAASSESGLATSTCPISGLNYPTVIELVLVAPSGGNWVKVIGQSTR